jgi:5'-nucleotidase
VVARPKILITNDDGWDAPGLAALRDLAAEIGEPHVLAPRDPHSYAGHRITTEAPLELVETAPNAYHLTGTPADCVRIALTTDLFPQIDWVFSGINRGGNLGADLFISGTVAAAREAALLGRPSLAISQYLRAKVPLDWETSKAMALPVIRQIMEEGCEPGAYWNVNLPHLDPGETACVVRCDPDRQPLDVRFERQGSAFRYSGTYRERPRTPGRDVEHCFGGSITVSRLLL